MIELIPRLKPVKALEGVAVVALTGAIDPRNVSVLQAAFETASRRGYRTLILDLGDIRYLNSAGLSCLVRLSDFLSSQGGRMELATPQPKLRVVLDLMGLSMFFKVYSSVEQAVGALERRSSRRPRVRAGGRP